METQVKGSQAVGEDRLSVLASNLFMVTLRQKLVSDGTLAPDGDHFVFTKDTEFSSPSAAASVIHGGSAAGRICWKNEAGKTLKEIEGD